MLLTSDGERQACVGVRLACAPQDVLMELVPASQATSPSQPPGDLAVCAAAVPRVTVVPRRGKRRVLAW
jgi:hypothetical protein